MLVPLPRVGSEYIKLRTGGELVKDWKLNEETQMFDFKSSSGEIRQVHRRDIEIPSANEELEFLSSKKRN